MRDKLCNEKVLLEIIEDNEKNIKVRENQIAQLMEDEKNSIQRFPISNKEVIFNKYSSIMRLSIELIRAKYSLGRDCYEIETIFENMINDFCQVGSDDIGYINTIWIISLGILLESDNDMMNKILEVLDEEEKDDVLYDYLFGKIGLSRKYKSRNFMMPTPFKELYDIVISLEFEKECGVDVFFDYVKCWTKKHSNLGFNRRYKDSDYSGLWGFELGAISKIYNLNDDKLETQSNYPFDLVHYKNSKVYNKLNINSYESCILVENDKEIINDHGIQSIIPNKLYRLMNDVIKLYNEIDSKEFWEKYNLNEVWYSLEDFEEDKDTSLGEIIVNILVDHEYILQLDYKEVDAEDADFGDIISWIPELWDCDNYKVIRFELDNDQYYFAKIPAENEICDLYEVKVSEVKL